MHVFLIKLGIQLNMSLLFFCFYSIVSAYLRIEVDYRVHVGIDVRLSVECATYIYLLMSLTVAAVGRIRGAVALIVFYGCAATLFIQPSGLPYKWLFWGPFGVFVMVGCFAAIYFLSNKTKKGIDSLYGWLFFLTPLIIQVGFYFLGHIRQWEWLIEITTTMFKWLGISSGIIIILTMLFKLGKKLNGVVDKFMLKIVVSGLVSVIIGELLLDDLLSSYRIIVTLALIVIATIIFVIEKRKRLFAFMKIIQLFSIKKAVTLALFFMVEFIAFLIDNASISTIVEDIIYNLTTLNNSMELCFIFIPALIGWFIHSLIDYLLVKKLYGKKYFFVNLLLIPILGILFLRLCVMAYFYVFLPLLKNL